MSNILKKIFMQSLMISTGILAVVTVEGIFYHLIGDDVSFSWNLPLSILLTGILCAVPTVLLLKEEVVSTRSFVLRIVIHTISLYFLVILMGYLFGWYSKWDGFLFVTGGYFFVYAFVWIANILMNKQEQKEINRALDHIRDEE